MPAILGVFLVAVCTGTVSAQQDTTGTGQALPDIAPQEVEIRGTMDISFPSLERQPLVGFNPPPSTYEIPDERQPYIEEYKQRAANLPSSSLQRPEPPEATGRFGTVQQGMLKTGAGRYFQRTIYGTLTAAVQPGLSVDAEVDYGGSQGHTPEDDADLSSSYDSFDGRLGLTSQGTNLQIYGELDGFYDAYVLYGARSQGFDPAAGPLRIEPNRNGAGAALSTGLQTSGIHSSYLEVSYGASRYETGTETADSTETLFVDREKRASVDALLNKTFGDFRLSTGGNFNVAGLDDNSVFDSDYFSYDAGLTGVWESGGAVDLELGARILGYTADSDVGGELQYISPVARLTFRVSNQLQLYARNTPSVSMPGLTGLYEENPYLGRISSFRPTIAAVDAEGGARIYRGSMQFAVWGGVREYPSYQYFQVENTAVAGFTRGFFDVGYDEARIIHAGGRASLQLPDGVQASLELKFRQARLTDNNIVIPYVSPATSNLSFAYPFAGRKGLLEVTGNIYGSRYVDLANDERVGAYVDFDAGASYDFTDSFGIYARIENMSVGALEEWKEYPQPSFVAQGGLRFFW